MIMMSARFRIERNSTFTLALVEHRQHKIRKSNNMIAVLLYFFNVIYVFYVLTLRFLGGFVFFVLLFLFNFLSQSCWTKPPHMDIHIFSRGAPSQRYTLRVLSFNNN